MKNFTSFFSSDGNKYVCIVLSVLLIHFQEVFSQQEWRVINTPTAPPARFGHSMVTLPDGRVLVFGGEGTDLYMHNDLFAYDCGQWTPITTSPPPSSRMNYGCCYGNGKVYVHAGKSSNPIQYFNDTWTFDPLTNEWNNVTTTNTPSARYKHKVNVHPDGYALISGGKDASYITLDEIWKFDMTDNGFTLVAHSPYAVNDHVAEIIDDKLYLLSENNTVQIYDITSNTWTSNQQGPPIRHGATSAVGANGSGQKIIFVFGGINNSGFISSTVYEYNTATSATTSRSTSMPKATAKWASATISGGSKDYEYLKVLFFGGWSAQKKIDSITMEFTVGAPVNLILQNLAIENGEDYCFNATDSIIVAGDTTYFFVGTGGSVDLVSGKNILLLQGTVVQEGGCFWGRITTNGEYCDGLPVRANRIPETPVTGLKEVVVGTGQADLMVYPNPTAGSFTVARTDSCGEGMEEIEIRRMDGTKVISEQRSCGQEKTLSIRMLPAGLYILQLKTAEKIFKVKLVKL